MKSIVLIIVWIAADLLTGCQTINPDAEREGAKGSAAAAGTKSVSSSISARISYPLNNSVIYTNTYTIAGTAGATNGTNTISQVYLKLDNGSYWPVSGTAKWSTNMQIPAGSHTITVYAKDVNSNISAEMPVTVTVTAAYPQVNITNVNNSINYCYGAVSGVTPANYKLAVWVENAWGLWIRPYINDSYRGINPDGSWSCNVWGYPGDGAHIVFADLIPMANDTDFDHSSIPVSAKSPRFIRCDSQAPVLTVNTPPSQYSHASLMISGTVKDECEMGGVYVSLNGANFQMVPNTEDQGSLSGTSYVPANSVISWYANLTLAPGNNTVKVYAKDHANHYTATNTYIVNYNSSMSPGGTVVLSDDFSGSLSKWVNTSGASISGGQLTVSDNESAPMISAAGANWTNYSIEAHVKVISAAAGILFRCQDVNNCYMWQLFYGKQHDYDPNNKWYFQPHKKVGGSWTKLKAVELSFLALNTTYYMKIEATGSAIKTYINGALIDTTADSSYSGGKVGFRESSTGEAAVFDNVKVILINYL